ncbi:MAG: TolC family protein [Deltaproteobacteria bacterium]|nr:TolC family protein [Deltaproteobacteria bacterium]
MIPALLLALALVDAAPTTSSEVPALLTFEDAVRIARDRSPDVALADVAVVASRAQARIAGALPNPAASFMAGWSSQCVDPGCNLPTYVATLGDQGAVAFLVTGQRGLAVDAAAEVVRAAEAGRLDVLRNLEFEVKRQFVATSVAWRAVSYGRREAERARAAVGLGRQRQAGGEISANDLSRLSLLQLQVEQAVDQAEFGHEQARLLLAQLLGMDDGAPRFSVVTGPTASADPPAALATATLLALLAEARQKRPDLAAARAQLDSARAAAELARRRVIPQFQLQAQYAQQGAPGGWFTPPTASFGLSLPLPVLDQHQGQIGVADAGVIAAEASLRKVEAQVAVDVGTALAAFQASRRQARRAEQELLQLSLDVRDIVGEEYAKGAASLLDYLETQRSRIRNEVEYLGTLQAFWTAVFQVERAVGTSYLP